MTPKEKAEELIKKFFEPVRWKLGQEDVKQRAKECALIAVDEIIDSSPRYPSDVDWDDCGATHQYYYEEQIQEALKFWKEVKQEIEKLGGQDE
jgi:hypothetical protein